MNTADVSASFTDKPRIEFVVVADHAAAESGKLYMNGGLWTEIGRPVIPGQPVPPSAFSIAVAVSIPWDDTSRQIPFAITVEDEDGGKMFEFRNPVVTGRPPQARPGTTQHWLLAVQVNAPFPKAGGYRAIATLEGGRDVRSWSFAVRDIHQQKLASS